MDFNLFSNFNSSENCVPKKLFFSAARRFLFEICRSTQRLILVFRLVGGQPFGLWPVLLLRDGEKLTEITDTACGNFKTVIS
jgi:hypothetical protein